MGAELLVFFGPQRSQFQGDDLRHATPWGTGTFDCTFAAVEMGLGLGHLFMNLCVRFTGQRQSIPSV